MPITFSKIQVGESYSRQTLASLWGYSSFQAIARGVVTPKGSDKIVLFITEKKQESAEQYADRLKDGVLECEGPTDHFAETRIIASTKSGEEVHLFHRERHHSNFVYIGMLKLVDHTLKVGSPSEFKFKVV